MHLVQWRNRLDLTTKFGLTNESGLGTHTHHQTAISTLILLFAIVLDSRHSLDSYIYLVELAHTQ
jgi:uncharacterized membrane protein